MLLQPNVALQNETSNTRDGGNVGTLILDSFALSLKGEMLPQVLGLLVMGAPWSRKSTQSKYFLLPSLMFGGKSLPVLGEVLKLHKEAKREKKSFFHKSEANRAVISLLPVQQTMSPTADLFHHW